MELQRRRNAGIGKWIIWGLLFLIIAGVFIVLGLFRVREIDVIGNEFYSAEEIENMVMKGSMDENSLYLKWKYSKEGAADELFFLNGVEISLVSPYHIQIRVYEKDIVGYMMYSGSLVYFDKDGIVVDISQETKDDIPAYTGIQIGQPEIQSKLPVADEAFLEDILDETSLMKQIGIVPKQVHYDENQEMILYFAKDLRVMMGKNSYMEEKMTNLLSLFSKMEGLSGTLHMEDFTIGTSSILFKKNETGNDELIFDVNAPDQAEGSEGGENQESQNSETDESASSYTADEERFSTDADGNEYYTDVNGNITYSTEQLYTNEDGSLITDGYGYIDPYTGAYVLN